MLRLAVALGKLAHHAARLSGRGGGTALPGLLAAKLCPDLLARLTALLAYGSLCITGTNGKTTTTRMLQDMLVAGGRRLVNNRHGSNLLRGATTAALVAARADGSMAADTGLWETDEMAFPAIAAAVRPRTITFLNLFRDQLDRYGETEKIRARWQEVLPSLGRPQLVLNADDPSVASLGDGYDGSVTYFGLDDPACRLTRPVHAVDTRTCRRCGAPLVFAGHYLGHLGDYRCTQCEWQRPRPAVRATGLQLSPLRSVFTLHLPGSDLLTVTLQLGGIYNVYNALAAAATAHAAGIAPAGIVRALEHFSAAFGRFERLTVAGREVCIFLFKNPTGADAVLQTLTPPGAPPFDLLLAINDLTADGHDISWLWDADFELLPERVRRVVATGIRAADMGVRLKYAGIAPAQIMVDDELPRALDALLADGSGPLYCLLTYTAMLELQRLLAARGIKAPYWEE